jgi:hypothetical protein
MAALPVFLLTFMFTFIEFMACLILTFVRDAILGCVVTVLAAFRGGLYDKDLGK